VTMPSQEEIENLLDSIYRTDDGDPAPMLERLPILVRHPALALAALRYLMTFPLVRVSIPGVARSKTRWLFDPLRPWNVRGFISSYIELPSPLDQYWQGTSKQNLRTRSHHARIAGLQVRAVDATEMNEVISQVWRDKGWQPHEMRRELDKIGKSLDGVVCVGVFDSSEHAIGFSLGTQTGEVVRTLWAYASQKGAVRWLCFSGYIEEVSAKGGRFIVESPPWAFTGGNRIFAGHLGFAPARVRRA
jgi:hypothetical protein